MSYAVGIKPKDLPEACKQDPHYKLYEQAITAQEAMTDEHSDDTAAYDELLILFNGKYYKVGCWSADVCGAVYTFLNDVAEFALSQLEGY